MLAGSRAWGVGVSLSAYLGPTHLITENLFPNLSLAHPPSPTSTKWQCVRGTQALALMMCTSGSLSCASSCWTSTPESRREKKGVNQGQSGYEAWTLCFSLPKLELRNSEFSEFAVKSPKLLGNVPLQPVLPLGPLPAGQSRSGGYLYNKPPPKLPHRQHSPSLFLKDTFVWGEGVSEHWRAYGRNRYSDCQFHSQNSHFSNSPLEAPTQNWPQSLPWGMGRLRGEEKVDREEGRDRNEKTDIHKLKYAEV